MLDFTTRTPNTVCWYAYTQRSIRQRLTFFTSHFFWTSFKNQCIFSVSFSMILVYNWVPFQEQL